MSLRWLPKSRRSWTRRRRRISPSRRTRAALSTAATTTSSMSNPMPALTFCRSASPLCLGLERSTMGLITQGEQLPTQWNRFETRCVKILFHVFVGVTGDPQVGGGDGIPASEVARCVGAAGAPDSRATHPPDVVQHAARQVSRQRRAQTVHHW